MGSIGVEPFQTTFAVPLHCDACVSDVSQALSRLDGVVKVKASLKEELIFVEGTTPPSAIISAIESTGRDAVLRGSGKSNSAGVCILETHSTTAPDKVRGLARMVQVSNNLTMVDLTIRGLAPGMYFATVRENGNISEGASSTGGIWEALKAKVAALGQPRGDFGSIEVGIDGKASAFLDRPVSIWEMLGRSMVVSKQKDGPFSKEDPNTLVGVIARSAGVWDNEKTVCSCSGKNVWEERKEQIGRGMM